MTEDVLTYMTNIYECKNKTTHTLLSCVPFLTTQYHHKSSIKYVHLLSSVERKDQTRGGDSRKNYFLQMMSRFNIGYYA